MDLTVIATPFYFGSMFVERRQLARRAAAEGANPADYQRPDTIASLTMGTASLLAPLAAEQLVKQVLPGKGRFPKALIRTAVAATVVTTVADRFAGWADEGAEPARASRSQRRQRIGRIAQRVRRFTGPLAVVAGGTAITTTFNDRTTPKQLWKHNGGRDLGEGILAWAVAIAGWDFIYYWNHRLMHEVRALWSIHVVHHSSERYNLSTALRQPVADVFGAFVPQGLMCLLGVRPRLVEHARGVNLLYQYWIHTDTIRKLGPGEAVLNTPSHHRVHHGSNSKYIDRNHGSILIVWDRLFRTFQREEEPVVYGLTKNIGTFNPLRIASHEYADIIRDIAGATNWHDRLSFVLRGPGWAYERHAEAAAQQAIAEQSASVAEVAPAIEPAAMSAPAPVADATAGGWS